MVLIVMVLLDDAALHPGCDHMKIGMVSVAAIAVLRAYIQWMARAARVGPKQASGTPAQRALLCLVPPRVRQPFFWHELNVRRPAMFRVHFHFFEEVV
jgi:hypothetical protein